jgi:hypothetical protein
MPVDRELSRQHNTGPRYLLIAVLALTASPVLAQTVTSLQNGSFETGTGSSIPNWTFTAPGSAIIVVKSGTSNAQVDTGSKAVKMMTSSSGSRLGSSRVLVSANTRYRFTARVRAVANQQGELHAVEWNAGGQQVADNKLAVSSGLNTFGWDTLRGYLVPQPTTQSIEVRLVSSLPAGGSATYYWDSVAMTAGDATAWEPWETTLTSTTDYSPTTNVNPYKDLVVTATYYQAFGSTCPAPPSTCSGASCFQGYGFWDGVPGAGRTFKLRTLFPAGAWCWATRCTGSSVCSSDSGLNTQAAQRPDQPDACQQALCYGHAEDGSQRSLHDLRRRNDRPPLGRRYRLVGTERIHTAELSGSYAGHLALPALGPRRQGLHRHPLGTGNRLCDLVAR